MTIFTSPFPSQNIPEISLTQYILGERQLPEKIAFTDPASGRTLTFAQLFTIVDNLSKNLQSFRFEKGTRVAILLPNCIDYCPLVLGAAAAGLTVTTINPLYTGPEIQKQLADAGARFMFTLPPFFEKCLEAFGASGNTVDNLVLLGLSSVAQIEPFQKQLEDKKLNIKFHLYSDLFDKEGPAEFKAQVDVNPKEDVVILPYSSGTTGLPKGVMLTHYNLVANCHQLDDVEPLSSTDVSLGVLPFFHIFGLVVTLFKGVQKRAHSVIMPRFELDKFLGAVQEFKVTRIYIVPPIALALAKHPLVDKFNVSSLKVLLSGAAPLSSALTEAVKTRLGVVVKQGYGMTELSPAASVDVDDPQKIKSGACGRLVSNTEAKIIDTADPTKSKEVGEEGELVVRGPQVMKGYLNKEDATLGMIDSDGWLHTGDVAYIDSEGYIWLVDRVKELIKYKGFQVPPAELEGILLSHPSIADAAVIGAPDEAAGEVPVAFVVKKPNTELTVEQVIEFVNKDISTYKKIHRVEWVDAIPKSASGKILRRILKASLVK